MLVVAAQRLPGLLWLLLGGVLFMHVADYLVIPILPVVLRAERGLSAGQVGLVLSVVSLFFLSGSLLGGALADRIGRRRSMVLGAALRAAGLAGLGTFADLLPLAGAGALGGLGSGFFAPAVKAAVAAVASGEHRTTAFSWRGIAANIGVGAAGLATLALAGRSGGIAFYVAAGIHLSLALLSWRLLPGACGAQVVGQACPRMVPGAVAGVLRNRVFLWFSAAAFLLWALYAQLALTLPLRASAVLANPKTVGLIWSINSAMVILTQALVTRWVLRRLHPITALAIGALFLGVGITALGFAGSFPALAAGAVVFVLGEMLVLPTFDSTVSQLAPAGQVGLFFGVANFVSGLGESAGNAVGGQWVERSQALVRPAPWLAFGAFGVVVAVSLFGLRAWQPLRAALRKAAADPAGPVSAPGVPDESAGAAETAGDKVPVR